MIEQALHGLTALNEIELSNVISKLTAKVVTICCISSLVCTSIWSNYNVIHAWTPARLNSQLPPVIRVGWTFPLNSPRSCGCGHSQPRLPLFKCISKSLSVMTIDCIKEKKQRLNILSRNSCLCDICYTTYVVPVGQMPVLRLLRDRFVFLCPTWMAFHQNSVFLFGRCH